MFVVGTCLLTILTPPHPQHTHTPVHFYLQSLGGTSLETFMFVDKVWSESRAYRDRQLGHKLRGFEMSCEYIWVYKRKTSENGHGPGEERHENGSSEYIYIFICLCIYVYILYVYIQYIYAYIYLKRVENKWYREKLFFPTVTVAHENKVVWEV